MAKAKPTEKKLTPEQEEHNACVQELNAILVKYSYTLQPYMEPKFRLVKVKPKEDEQKATEGGN